jgi:hypothetical protein
VPFYSVIANHDLNGRDATSRPAIDFDRAADAGGYFTNLHLPNNAPMATNATSAIGKSVPLARFKEMAGSRFPNMANYSYDYGDAHFTCLDSNLYVDTTDEALHAWIRADIMATDARWKFVVYHHPAFNAGDDHYDSQHMRALAPLFEELGVDMVLSGHEHTYQRTLPIKFAPRDLSNAKFRAGGTRLIPGTFTIDRNFDGKSQTKPNGVIYITTGAGGKHLYDPGFSDDPSKWRHPEDDNVEYVSRFISDRHSLTVFDLDAKSLTMRQIDEWGNEVDRIRITKA